MEKNKDEKIWKHNRTVLFKDLQRKDMMAMGSKNQGANNMYSPMGNADVFPTLPNLHGTNQLPLSDTLTLIHLVLIYGLHFLYVFTPQFHITLYYFPWIKESFHGFLFHFKGSTYFP